MNLMVDPCAPGSCRWHDAGRTASTGPGRDGKPPSSVRARVARRVLLGLAGIALWSASAADAAPLAGTRIDSQASVRYLAGPGPEVSVLQSNIVSVFVQAVEALTLSDGQSVNRPPGAGVDLAHRLTNTGNTPTTYTLSLAHAHDDAFDLAGLQLVHDVNGNGVADPGEPVVGNITLGPGEAADLVVSGHVPGAVTSGVTRFSLQARSASGKAATITDAVTVQDSAVLAVQQTASDTQPAPGARVSLRIFVRNLGKNAAYGMPVSVDGVEEDILLITIPVPPNTTLDAAFPLGEVVPMYHRIGDPATVFSRQAPADLSLVDEVVYGMDNLPAGAELHFDLRLLINWNAGGVIQSTSRAQYSATEWSDEEWAMSNTLRFTVVPFAHIAFYDSDGFANELQRSALGTPLYVKAEAAACNRNTSQAETVQVVVTSAQSGDQETFAAVETGPNTGTFRVPQEVATASALSHGVTAGDGRVSSLRGDALTLLLPDCGSGAAQARLMMEPVGVVFDSRSNAPIAGVSVTLLDVQGAHNGGRPGEAARVFAADGVTPAAATVVTDAEGRYEFAFVMPGTYRLRLEAPGYGFPSAVEPDKLPAGRILHIDGSYGKEFTGASVTLDLPIDSPQGGLMVEVEASRKTAELGDFVDYTVRVRNVSGVTLPEVNVVGALPPGFALQAGTLRRDGLAQPDPAPAPGGFDMSLGALPNDTTRALSYRARIGPTTPLGDAIARAQASNRRPALGSNTGTALVRVEGGVFDTKGFALGKIYADCNANGIQDAGEPGVPGVRIWLEDGTWAISDGEGKYSFYNLSPRTHVAKVDATTLPRGARLVPIANRNALDGGSRFIDMKNGELQRADFALAACDEPVQAEIRQRRERARQSASEVEAGARTQLTLESGTPAQSAIASGTINPQAGKTPLPGMNAPAPAFAASAAPARPATAVVSLPEAVAGVDNSVGFVDPADRRVLAAPQATLRIKGPMGSRLQLRVGDEVVPATRIGLLIEQPERHLQAVEYIGVPLRTGENRVAAEQLGSDGSVLARRVLTLIAPGELERIVIEPVAAALADGIDSARVVVRLEDGQGTPVLARTPLTLETSQGEWQVADLNPLEPGVQVFVEGGRGEFVLRSPQAPGDAQIRATAGMRSKDAVVSFLPPLRELLASGLVEGVLSLRKLGSGALQRTRDNDGFEQEIQRFSQTNGDTTAAARAALFLKGKVKGEYLLTLGYDSDKDTKARLFRDIEPDRFYPVYGDASVKGFDAQTTGHLYVRVDKGKSWLLYGDLLTSNSTLDPARNLAAYNRALNGLRHHYEQGRVTADTFLARQSSRQRVQEIPANGTSGPFAIGSGNLVVNSERVEVVTRDRRQQSQVLRVTPLARFSDYTLEPFSGSLLLRAPVPSVDADLNDNFIRITYEVDDGGAAFWVGGTDLRVKLVDNDRFKVQAGAVAVEDRDPLDRNTLRGVNLSAKSGDVTMIAEAARSDYATVGSGRAERFEVRKETGPLQGRVYAGRSDAGFKNPSSILSQGRAEHGGKLSYGLDDRTRLIADVLATRDDSRGTERKEWLAGIERSFDNQFKLEFAARQYKEESATREIPPQEATSVRTRLTTPVPGVPEATVFGEVEQAVDGSNRRMLAAGGDYRIADRTRLYGRYEFVSELASYVDADTRQRNTAVFGLDTQYMPDARAFSEYRARDAFTGREAEAAMGLRNQWRVAEGVALHTSFERVQALQGADSTRRAESTALTGAVEYTRHADWKATARMEWRGGPGSESFLNTLGYAHKLNEEWTFLARNIFNRIDNKTPDSGDRRQERFQAGFAYRDLATNVWNALGRYEFKFESDSTPGSDYRRNVHIVSTHANVQLSRDVIVNGRYAAKLAREHSLGLTSQSRTHLVSARATYDLSERWDTSVIASRLWSPGSGAAQYGLGAEVGYLVMENLWLSVGYNVTGYRERDLVSEDRETARGVYLRLRFKFDEKMFERF
ncbi:MAG: SdrD B-like domain-containing protein [Candidatus Dactylopiibacterium sp.]|nr:SdrD B-like domain-containing protein [Candidatus Dactylopiibacterium sp.]